MWRLVSCIDIFSIVTSTCDHFLRASVLLRRGECYYNLSEFDEALLRYDRLIENPEAHLHPEGQVRIGELFIA